MNQQTRGTVNTRWRWHSIQDSATQISINKSINKSINQSISFTGRKRASQLTQLQQWMNTQKEREIDQSLINSFIQAISIAPLQVHYYSEALPTQHGYCAGVSRQSNCE